MLTFPRRGYGMAGVTLTNRLVDSLYTEAMLLADTTRGYFEGPGVEDRKTLRPTARVLFACEALKATTRIMQIVAWLLTRKAVAAGELDAALGDAPQRRLGPVPPLDPQALERLPVEVCRLLEAGVDLYERVRRLDRGLLSEEAEAPPASPALSLLHRLERSL
jgi:regulator of CtrA degradation